MSALTFVALGGIIWAAIAAGKSAHDSADLPKPAPRGPGLPPPAPPEQGVDPATIPPNQQFFNPERSVDERVKLALATNDPLVLIALADQLEAEGAESVGESFLPTELRAKAQALAAAQGFKPSRAEAAAAPPPVKGYPTLRAGAVGLDVERLQRALNAHGMKVAITGKYDAPTVAAVKSYQTLNKLSIDGVTGPQTWNSLVTT